MVASREVEEGSCEEAEFHCTSGECLNIEKLCNGQPDCGDGSDENLNRFFTAWISRHDGWPMVIRCGQRIAVRQSDQEHYGRNSGLLEVKLFHQTKPLGSVILTYHNIITKSSHKWNITTRCVIKECGELCVMNTLARGRQKCSAGLTNISFI